MNRRSKSSSSTTSKKRTVQPKSAAWSVQKSSLVRMGPQTLVKSGTVRKGTGATSATTTTSIKKRSKTSALKKPIDSQFFGKMKADLEMDAHDFNAKLKDLLPTAKSLPPRSARSFALKQRSRTPTTSALAVKPGNMPASIPFSSLMAAPPMGEKLITIGGYIISVQSGRQDVTSIVKPRVSTDKEGLEVEIKIVGCKPTDIKFERRYDTLIVIGVTNPPPQPPAPVVANRKGVLQVSKAQPGPSSAATMAAAIGIDHLDEMHELVNIFVPKNISINQVFISNPDAKGRIFVKGP